MNFLHCHILSQRYFFLQKQLSLFLESMPQLPHTQHHVLVLDMCICMSRWNRVALVTVVVKTIKMFGGFEIQLGIATPDLTRSWSWQCPPPSPSRRSCSQAIGEQRTSSPQCQRIGRVEGLGSGEVWIGRERGGAMKLDRDGLVCRSRIHVSLGNLKKEGLHTCAYSVKLSLVSGNQRVWKSKD